MPTRTRWNQLQLSSCSDIYAYVPDQVEPRTVVLAVNDKLVKVWDFEEGKDGNLKRSGFMPSFVMPFMPEETSY